MKKIRYVFFVVFLMTLLLACKNKLSDVELNNNPYDRDYVGDKVVQIDSITTVLAGFPAVATTYVYVAPLTQHYLGVKLYRNGTLIKTIDRISYSTSSLIEMIVDNTPPTVGVTYSYEASLTDDPGETQRSEPVSHLTN